MPGTNRSDAHVPKEMKISRKKLQIQNISRKIARKILIYKGWVARILRFHHTLHKADITNGRN